MGSLLCLKVIAVSGKEREVVKLVSKADVEMRLFDL